MYQSILYVEDGSVDVDQLQEDLGEDVYIVVYRQGSTQPTLIQPEKPLQSVLDSECVRLQNKIKRVVKILNSAFDLNMSKRLRAILNDILIELD